VVVAGSSGYEDGVYGKECWVWGWRGGGGVVVVVVVVAVGGWGVPGWAGSCFGTLYLWLTLSCLQALAAADDLCP
jgi:hypothetical protein